MTWKFDSTVAETFVEHARQHIPDYDRVIDKSVAVCQKFLKPNSHIIDVGSATGETIRRLHAAGFTNLSGVESSHAMLKHCDYTIAKYYHNNRLPIETYDAIICNWTLHFIQDKLDYMFKMYKQLAPGGFLILSEKTSLDPLPIEFYHDIKRANGVTDEQIRAKELAVKDVMHINNVEWFLYSLKEIGFDKVHIIDANWCFTTFLATKGML